MTLIQIDHNPSSRQLNVFGFIWLVFFGIAGGIVLKNSGSAQVAILVWCLATVVPAVDRMVDSAADPTVDSVADPTVDSVAAPTVGSVPSSTRKRPSPTGSTSNEPATPATSM